MPKNKVGSCAGPTVPPTKSSKDGIVSFSDEIVLCTESDRLLTLIVLFSMLR